MTRSRASSGILLASLALAGFFAARAQQSRSAYQDAYRDWRTADPNLERDAANADPNLVGRADKAGIGATKYAAARKAYFDAVKTALDKEDASMELVEIPAEPANTTQQIDTFVAASTRAVAAGLQTFANDPDRALQQLRLALDRERTALAGISSAAKDRQAALDAVTKAAAAAEQARTKVDARYQAIEAGLDQAAQSAIQQGSAWSDYYQKLAEGSKGSITTSSATPSSASSTRASVEPAPASPSTPATPAVITPGTPSIAPAIANPAPAARSVTPLPLSRYTGAWMYSTASGVYHGTEPSSIDLTVREENGQASGTMTARFKVPPNTPGDWSIVFTFAGEMQATRNQMFPLKTADGVAGTIELIPGPAFNLLEVNFTTGPRTGKITQGNFLLVKR